VATLELAFKFIVHLKKILGLKVDEEFLASSEV
jgi:hypothetical protein